MERYDWLDAYLLAKRGAQKDFKVEWQWWRYQVGGKLFAATVRPDEKYAPMYAGKNLLTLKCEPLRAELYRKEYAQVLPGFYTDKRSWNSVVLDGSLPDDVLREMCDHSYALVFSKLTKKLQQQLLDGAE